MTDTEPTEKKKPMTHEERLALAAKLDKELDDFIAGLERRKYTEGWPEDRWEEEMEKHPFFMTKLPEDGQLSPLLEGIQQLKYDENENAPRDLALSYKDDGNFNFKYKKYRLAILSYTEGIRRKCGDAKLEAELYNNRAAAQFFLENYRSSLSDCKQALKLQPDYMKAKIRAAQCCAKIKNFEEAIKFCDEILEKQPEEPTALKIRTEAVAIEKQKGRDSRKQKIEEKKLQNKLECLKSAIEKRKIQLDLEDDILTCLEFSQEKPILENSELNWPVFFLYPQYHTSDYIEQFNEYATFYDHLSNMFMEPPEWDNRREYTPEKLALYHEGFDRSKLYPVEVNNTLLDVLTSGKFVVREFKLSFLVLVKGSISEENFLKNYTLVR